MNPTVACLPSLPLEETRSAIERAVALGGNCTLASAEAERLHDPVCLLGLAVNRLPTLAVYLAGMRLHLLVVPAEPVPADLCAPARDVAAGAIRLAVRALEVHGRDVGYATERWLEGASVVADALLAGARDRAGEGGESQDELVSQAVEPTALLTRAMASARSDRMAVPELVELAVAHLLLAFRLSDELGG